MKKLLALLLACLMVLSASAVLAEEVPTLTRLMSPAQTPNEDNMVLKELNERLGINFEPTYVNGNSYQEKYNALAAAGMLPDFLGFSNWTDMQEMIDNGVIMPLNDLLDQYGQEIIANRGDDLYTGYQVVDGKVYGIQAWYEAPAALMVRQDWLKAVGMEMPKTLDEFYDVMYAFTYNDPDGNGEDDTFGLSCTMEYPTTIHFIFSAYGIAFDRPAMVDGKVVPYFMHPNYLDAVAFVRKCLDAKIIEPDFVTIANLASLEKLWNGTAGAYFGNPVGTTNNWLGRYTEETLPEFGYTYITGPDGVGGSQKVIASDFVAINANCKYPEAAMKLLNYICSEEGNELVYAGVEGVYWQRNEDGTFSYIGDYQDSNYQRVQGGFIYWGDFRKGGMDRQNFNEITRYGLSVGESSIIEDAYISQRPEIDADITFNANEMFGALLHTTGDVQMEYEAFVDEYLMSGGDLWIEQATEIYNMENK